MRILPAGLIFIDFLVGLGSCKPGCVETVDRTRQNGWQGSFVVRIERTPESCALFAAVAGANYLISSRQGPTGEWKKIAVVHHDDPLEIPKDSIVVLNENVAYAFLFWEYVVTVDGGESWRTFDVNKRVADLEPSQGEYGNYAAFQNVEIKDDGRGKMYLERARLDNGAVTLLTTNDFGQTWFVEK